MNDPIDRIEWRQASTLTANAYNPNVVLNRELRLLEHSILTTGWCQPLIVSPAGQIIDGFHRWRLARDSKALWERYGGKVPCAILDVSEPEAMLMTVRMNRAKGTHVAVRMADLVQALVDDHGYTLEQVAQGMGSQLKEVQLLYQDSLFKAKNLSDYRYSRAWVPRETGTRGRPKEEAPA